MALEKSFSDRLSVARIFPCPSGVRTMRFLVVGVLVAFVAPVHAADKNEDKAKETAAAFLKALVAKDIDAVMKRGYTPFVFDFGHPEAKTIDKSDELKEVLTKLLETANPDKVKTLEVG